MSYRDSMNDRIESDCRWQEDIMAKHRDHPPLTDYSTLPNERDERIARLTAENAKLREALRGVIRVADRKTDEFDFARAALADADTGEGMG